MNHDRRYPDWNMDDLYKLIHQAALGNEHSVLAEDQIRDWLKQETADLTSGPPEPLIDPISADHRVVRIHLRPFVERSLDQDVLIKAMISTAKRFDPSHNMLNAYTRIAMQLIQEQKLPFTPEQFSRYIAKQRSAGFPPVRHSLLYSEKYHPAYRVVARETLPKSIMS
jgi:hypothetical protein